MQSSWVRLTPLNAWQIESNYDRLNNSCPNSMYKKNPPFTKTVRWNKFIQCAHSDTPRDSLGLASRLSTTDIARQAGFQINTMPIVTLNFLGCNISLPHHTPPRYTGNPTLLTTLTWILIHAFWMAEPQLRPRRRGYAFNNEVWAGTISPLCHTRSDPWGDVLVVMVLIQQSLPQRPGSIELHYKTLTHAFTMTQKDNVLGSFQISHPLRTMLLENFYLITWYGSRLYLPAWHQ